MQKLLSILLPLILVCAEIAHAKPSKADITAAMVYRLTKFVRWSDAALEKDDRKFYICFSEPNPVYDILQQAKLKQWHGRDMLVIASISDQCHVVVSEDQPPQNVTDVLLIGSTSDFLERGGHVRLSFKRGRLNFHINRTEATAAGLFFSSELLSLASEVR